MRTKENKVEEERRLIDDCAAKFVHSCLAAKKSDLPLKVAYLAAESAAMTLRGLCSEFGYEMEDKVVIHTKKQTQEMHLRRLKRFKELKIEYDQNIRQLYKDIRHKYFNENLSKNRVSVEVGTHHFRVFEAILYKDQDWKMEDRRVQRQLIELRSQGRGTTYICNHLHMSHYIAAEMSFHTCYESILDEFDNLLMEAPLT